MSVVVTWEFFVKGTNGEQKERMQSKLIKIKSIINIKFRKVCI